MDFDKLLRHARDYPARRPADAGPRLATGQSPTALFVTCADSRVVPAEITSATPGTLFELRTAGNIIPPFAPDVRSGEVATIEFAVVELGVADLVICGHSHCGAVRALHGHAGELEHLPALRRWLDRPERATTPVSDPGLRAEGRRHVAEQVRALAAYPFVQERLRAGTVRLHGWFYDIESGRVEAALADEDRLAPL